MKWQTLSALLASAGLMAACGGGGGDNASATPESTNASVTLSGTAAKGLMANAVVTVHPIKADGSVDTATVLATTTTDDKGKYTLPVFKIAKSQPYVVKVSVQTDPSKPATTHLDEVLKTATALPSGFAMRSVRFAPSTATPTTDTTSITPFTEMAVAAAVKAGGVTTANAQQALKVVNTLLNIVDVTQVTPAAGVAEATTEEQKKLAVMLTAVSQLANSSELGCTDASGATTNGAKTQCVVEKLASAASTTAVKLETATLDVSAKLAGAVNTVLADPDVASKVDASSLVSIVANLACTKTSTSDTCAVPTTGSTTTDPVATAIAAARLFIGEVKTDWTAMFSAGGATSIATGALNKQAFAFDKAMREIGVPAELMIKDVGALSLAASFYNDYKSGRIPATENQRGRGDVSMIAGGNGISAFASTAPIGCGVYRDAEGTVLATSRDNVARVYCSARYYLSRTNPAAGTTVYSVWRHRFALSPNADGSFSFEGKAHRGDSTCFSGSGCTNYVFQALQLDAQGKEITFAGTITPTTANTGEITKLNIEGDLPAPFISGTNVLSTSIFKHQLKLDVATAAAAADGSITQTASGKVTALSEAGAVVSSATIKPSSVVNVLDDRSVDRHSTGMLSLDLVFSNTGAEFEGTFAITESTWDKSKTQLVPTKASLSGTLRTVTSGTASDFLKGVFTATIPATGTGSVASFDATVAKSSNNFYSVDASFVGAISASGRPTIELTLGGGWIEDSMAGRAKTVDLQYRTLVNGTPRSVVKLTGEPDASTGALSKLTLAEQTNSLSMVWTPGASSVDLMQGTRKVGTLAVGSGVLTFTDSTFISLDFGL